MISTNKMNLKMMIRNIVLCLLLTPMAAAAEVYSYAMEGEITRITRNSITLEDGAYSFMPTVKVFNLDGKSTSTSSLRKGDYVQVTILYMDKKRRVDKIERIKNPNSR